MIFDYNAFEPSGARRTGTIEAGNADVALASLQRRGLMVSSLKEQGGKKFGWGMKIDFSHVTNKDIVILSRQISTLFGAQVSALQVFKLISTEVDKEKLRKVLGEVVNDLQGGASISNALSKHPTVFSEFYVNMVKAGEESGKLDEIFGYLAEHLEKSNELMSKAKNALIYPAFIIVTFIVVMALMLVKVIPNLSAIIKESGQELPIYTRVVIGFSDFLVNYGVFILLAVVALGVMLWRYSKGESGRQALSSFRLGVPYLGMLYSKLFLARLAGNLSTMFLSAIPIVRAVEITSDVVGDYTFHKVLKETAEDLKAGNSLSQALAKHHEMPNIIIQMIHVGEESGELGSILKMLARFYEREVSTAVDTMVGLIEPVMIISLALGVGFLLASVLMPIYNMAGAIS